MLASSGIRASLVNNRTGSSRFSEERLTSSSHADLAYEQALAPVGLETLHARHERAYAFYQKMQDPRHKLHHLLPETSHLTYGLRQSRKYAG